MLQITYDPNRASEVLNSFTFRDVMQGRVAIEETLSDGDSELHNNKSAGGHAPATSLSDSFTFLVRAGNVQPAKGELHFTILPHHHMHHGPGSSNTDAAGHTTTHLPTHNKTTIGRAGERGGDRGISTTLSGAGVGSPPHILMHKTHNRTQHKLRPHSRWGNHTRSGSHKGRSGSHADGAGGGHSHTPKPHTPPVSKHGPPAPPDTRPAHVEFLPRPAADPLLIILPLLACLLLIVILVVLILVFRRRREKDAQLRVRQQLAAVTLPPEGSPYLGWAEQSMAMPSVVVTPLGPASCPNSPRVKLSHKRRSLAPGMTFWGPFEADGEGEDGNIGPDNINERDNVMLKTLRSRSSIPTLKDNQYWV